MDNKDLVKKIYDIKESTPENADVLMEAAERITMSTHDKNVEQLQGYHCEARLCIIYATRTCRDCAHNVDGKCTMGKRKGGTQRKCFLCAKTEDCDKKVFTILARRCRICNGLITSKKCLRTGVGECCSRKEDAAAMEEEQKKNQMTIFDFLNKDQRGE